VRGHREVHRQQHIGSTKKVLNTPWGILRLPPFLSPRSAFRIPVFRIPYSRPLGDRQSGEPPLATRHNTALVVASLSEATLGKWKTDDRATEAGSFGHDQLSPSALVPGFDLTVLEQYSR